jgi:hypothetical protein
MSCVGTWQRDKNWESMDENIQPDPKRTDKPWIICLQDCGMALKCGLMVRLR